MKNKTTRIYLRATTIEKAIIKQKAAKCEMTVSDFLIASARNVEIKLYKKTIPASVNKTVLAMLQSANNFNQFTRYCHSDRLKNIAESELHFYANRLYQLANEIKNALQ
ncbi:plasmid mobilization protein [Rhizosphaericola mali]|uniref:Mobilization protein n=1 Tax=Rhizosphaericola mali TaxID=2545455 RepID=A0A5P2FWS7_9BACT|nr:hypothetical protein [Rhizosphaericola mali]QES87635.1 hypothetical protein E0W69_002770 [Rhizosphaericola mali]